MDAGWIGAAIFAVVGVLLVLAFVYFVWLDGRSMPIALAVTALFAIGVVAWTALYDIAPPIAYWVPWASMGASILVVRQFKRRHPRP